MIKKQLKTIGNLASIGVLILCACTGGTGEGNPEFGLLSVSLRAESAPLGAGGAMGSGGSLAMTVAANDTLRLFDKERTPFSIDHIYTYIDRVEINRPSQGVCRSSEKVTCTDSSLIVSGQRFVDLLERPSPLILDSLQLPLGVYTRMKIHTNPLPAEDSANIPEPYVPLIGHSIMMKGHFSYKGISNRSMTIYLDFNEVFSFENSTGLAISQELVYSWSGVFQASEWLKNLELTDCLDENKIPLEPDGDLVIDGSSDCNDWEDSILENVRHSTTFRKSDENDR